MERQTFFAMSFDQCQKDFAERYANNGRSKIPPGFRLRYSSAALAFSPHLFLPCALITPAASRSGISASRQQRVS
jgi:hypothetical protein